MLKKVGVGLCVLLCAVIIYFVCAFFGNPVSKILATKNTEEYVQENWPDAVYNIEAVKYDFKTSAYCVIVTAPDSIDNHFTVYCGLDGKISYDTYESCVLKKWNAAERINDEYRKAVDDLFDSDEFLYDSDIFFGDIDFADSDYSADENTPDYAIKTENLILDAQYDVNEIGKKAGCLTVYVYNDVVTAEKLAEILIDIKALMDKGNVAFRAVNCVLEYTRAEDGSQIKSDRLEVRRFLYDDIYEDGLVERVKAADAAAREYYEKQDLLK